MSCGAAWLPKSSMNYCCRAGPEGKGGGGSIAFGSPTNGRRLFHFISSSPLWKLTENLGLWSDHFIALGLNIDDKLLKEIIKGFTILIVLTSSRSFRRRSQPKVFLLDNSISITKMEGIKLDLIDNIRDLSIHIQKQAGGIQTEEATKNAFVMPFISALGYNVFDPTEVTPELIADVGTKKGEKVDYAILLNGKPIILFECKWCGSDLDKEHASQLYRYFSVTEARFGVLTNGIIYRFYSDLEKANVMDEKPFLEFNMLEMREPLVEELKKFSKSAFDLDNILATASELKYMKELRRIIEEQINNPSDDFVKFFALQVYSGRLTQSVREQFAQITKKAFKQFINDRINDRLNIALTTETPIILEKQQEDTNGQGAEEIRENRIETTEEEFEAYYIIKTVLRDAIDPKRINIRDAINYCAIILDGSPRKPVARLYFNGAQKHIALFDEEKHEEKISINSVDDIYSYSDRLKAVASHYDPSSSDSSRSPLTGKSLKSFTFKERKYETKYWKDMLLQLCSAIAELNKDKFDEVLTITGRHRPFFSKNPGDLRTPNHIEGTDVYAEANLSADSITRLSKSVMSKFGYPETDLAIETL